jgi:hypothetical protein
MKLPVLLIALPLTATVVAGAAVDSGTVEPRPAAVATAPADRDTSIAAHLIQPEQLAMALEHPGPRPALLQVGFKVLYRTGHIAGSRYAGPGSKPEGLAALDSTLRSLPKDQRIVLYCGCCPWQDCPNVRPAFREASRLGYHHVEVLFVRKNLQEDWIARGFPMREGDR